MAQFVLADLSEVLVFLARNFRVAANWHRVALEHREADDENQHAPPGNLFEKETRESVRSFNQYANRNDEKLGMPPT